MVDEIKKRTILRLYRYSDLAIPAIAQQVDLDEEVVQQVVDNLEKEEALEVVINQSTTRVEKIMSGSVFTLDCSKTPREVAELMAEHEIGSVVVTKDGTPFGIVTQSDIVRWAGKWPKLLSSSLESNVSRPLITVRRDTNIEEAANIMIKNRIHRLPVVEDGKLFGIVTITDLAVFLSPTRRLGIRL